MAKDNESGLVVGIKQTLRLAEQDRLSTLFIAEDADQYVIKPALELAAQNSVPVVRVESKKKLGKMCGIEIGAAVAGAIKSI